MTRKKGKGGNLILGKLRHYDENVAFWRKMLLSGWNCFVILRENCFFACTEMSKSLLLKGNFDDIPRKVCIFPGLSITKVVAYRGST